MQGSKDDLLTLAAANPVVTYIGNGSANVFSFPFPVFSQGDIVVLVVSASQSYLLAINTDYTISGLNSGDPASVVGAVTLVSSGQAWLSGGKLATGYTIILQRVVSLAQLTSVRNQGDFYPEVIEDSLDYLMMAIQQIQAGVYVINDLVNGHTYRLVMINGVLSQVQVS